MRYRFRVIPLLGFVLQIRRDSGEWENADSITAQIAADILNQEVPKL